MKDGAPFGLGGTRAGGFVLTRQEPAGKWGAASYANIMGPTVSTVTRRSCGNAAPLLGGDRTCHGSALMRRLDSSGCMGSQPERPSVEDSKETADLPGFGCEVDIVVCEATVVDELASQRVSSIR